jgi:hypothetical protein
MSQKVEEVGGKSAPSEMKIIAKECSEEKFLSAMGKVLPVEN